MSNSFSLLSNAIHTLGETTEKRELLFDSLKTFFKAHLEDYQLILMYSDGEFRSALTMDFLVEQQRETGIMLCWNFFASNHGGGAADADVNTAQLFLKHHVQNNNVTFKGNVHVHYHNLNFDLLLICIKLILILR